jgi:hypothetical protein
MKHYVDWIVAAIFFVLEAAAILIVSAFPSYDLCPYPKTQLMVNNQNRVIRDCE